MTLTIIGKAEEEVQKHNPHLAPFDTNWRSNGGG